MNHSSMEIIIVSLVICLTIMLVGLFWQRRYLRRRRRAELDHVAGGESSAMLKEQQQINNQLLPMGLFAVLGHSNIAQITLHDSKEMKVTIMNANISDFETNVRFMEPQAVYNLINQILSGCVPAVYEYGGEISEFHNAGFVATYTKEYEQALNTAILMCEYVGTQTSQHLEYQKFSVGLCYGTVMVGVVGHQRRMALSILSTYTGLASYLQMIAGSYYARIMVTGSYLERIKEVEVKYNYRFLGYLYIKSANVIEKIYDMFDGDDVEIRNKKRKTRKVFEKGIKVFTERDFETARIYFIEVLKTDRYDLAARAYVLLCEKNLADQNINAATTSVYFEVY